MIDYLNNSTKIYDNNIFNLDTERFYREAEDYFFYFGRNDKAISKLKQGIKLSPTNIKSLKFLGDIYFATGKMQNAFDYYSQAAALKPNDTQILSSMAVVCEALKNYQNALDFLNLAFQNYTIKETRLYAQMCDLKISLLIKLQKYAEAKIFLDKIKKSLPIEEIRLVEATNNSATLKKKLSLRERIETLHIKVV